MRCNHCSNSILFCKNVRNFTSLNGSTLYPFGKPRFWSRRKGLFSAHTTYIAAGQFLPWTAIMGENGSRDIWIGNEGQQMFCQSIRKMGGKFFFTYQVSTFPTVIYNQESPCFVIRLAGDPLLSVLRRRRGGVLQGVFIIRKNNNNRLKRPSS